MELERDMASLEKGVSREASPANFECSFPFQHACIISTSASEVYGSRELLSIPNHCISGLTAAFSEG